MSLGRELLELLDEEVDLGRGRLAVMCVVDEDRVEGELAQPSERREDRDAVGLRVTQQAEHPLPLALEVLVVDVAVDRVRGRAAAPASAWAAGPARPAPWSGAASGGGSGGAARSSSSGRAPDSIGLR